MKRYFVLLLLSFVLVSCNKTETQPITIETPKNTEQEVSKSGNNVVVENDSISNTGDINEIGSGENKEITSVNKENLQKDNPLSTGKNNDIGKITLSGKILTWGNGPICFRPNKDNVEKLPKDNDGFTYGWFCFSQDENYIMNKFGFNEKMRINGLELYEVGTAEIIISEYSIFRKETMGADSAKLEEILQKNIYKEATIENKN